MIKDEAEATLSELSHGVVAFRKEHPRKIVEEKTVSARQAEIISALNEFMECVRYLNTRRTKGTILALANEADVQDALFLMLRLWNKDLRYEEPTQKSANRYSIPDFLIPSAKLVIEAKFVRDKRHGKEISKEIHDDIEMYRKLPECSRIVFFIYDPESHVPSMDSLKDQICVPRSYGTKEIVVDLIDKP